MKIKFDTRKKFYLSSPSNVLDPPFQFWNLTCSHEKLSGFCCCWNIIQTWLHCLNKHVKINWWTYVLHGYVLSDDYLKMLLVLKIKMKKNTFFLFIFAIVFYLVSYLLIVNESYTEIRKYTFQVVNTKNSNSLRDAKIEKLTSKINRLLQLESSTGVEDEKLRDVEGKILVYSKCSVKIFSKYSVQRQWRITDFPKRGRQPIIWPICHENYVKMKKFGVKEGVEPSRPWIRQ